jgi:hypothetical protein
MSFRHARLKKPSRDYGLNLTDSMVLILCTELCHPVGKWFLMFLTEEKFHYDESKIFLSSLTALVGIFVGIMKVVYNRRKVK